MTGVEIFSGLKSPNLQFVSLYGLARYDLRQLVPERIVSDDSDDPTPMCIRQRIAGPLDELQEVEQVRSLDLILRGGILWTNTLDGHRRCPCQQQECASASRADPLRPTLGRVGLRVVVKGRRIQDL